MEISIIFLPLIASIISGFFGKYIGDRNSEIVTSALVSISALLSISVLYQVIVNQYEENIVMTDRQQKSLAKDFQGDTAFREDLAAILMQDEIMSYAIFGE